MQSETTAGARPLAGFLSRKLLLGASQWLALAVAGYLGWHAYQMVDDNRLAIDRASLYYLVALVLAVYFTWDGVFPHAGSWPRRVAACARTHPVELGLVAVVCAAGTFVRLFRYGTLPPNGYIILEEHIYSGIGWDIIHGGRPYIYPIPTYLGALSLWLIGPSTTGIRGYSLLAGIITIPLFYVMMREVAGRAGALFATAIWAAARATNDIGPHQQTLYLGEVLLVWFTLRSLNSGRIMWLVPAAALAALLSYEYETAKALPLFVAPFLAWVSIRALVWPLPRKLSTIVPTVVQRAKELGPRALRAVAVVSVVILILIGPMVAESHRGRNIYFSSLDRQKADREARGTPGLISPDWFKQVKWSAQAYTPWVDPDYPIVTSLETRGMIDKITSLLMWAALASGIVFFWKGYRALFVGWFLGGMLISSLLLSNWGPWKVAGWLVPAAALTGFLADDIYNLVKRRRHDWALACAAVMAVIAAGAFALNLRALNANANDQRVLGEFSNTPSYLYSICDQLKRRPDDNYAVVTQRVRSQWGFSSPPGDLDERRAAWGDFRFICWDLQGRTAADLQEVWPFYPDADRPYSLITAISDGEAPAVIDAIERAMPELGPPDTHADSPGRGFQTLVWDTTREQLNARRGLVLRSRSSGGETSAEEVATGPAFHVPPQTGGGSYSLSGLVYLDTESDVALVPNAGAPSVRIKVDAAVTYDGASGAVAPARRLRGWHLVEVQGLDAAGGDIELQWRDGNGNAIAVSPDGYFALRDMAVWQHVRSYIVDATEFRAMRYDFYPHVISMDGMRMDARDSLPFGARATQDQYTGILNIPADRQYRFTINAPSQATSFKIDGQELMPNDGIGTTWIIDKQLTAGDHTVQLTFFQKRQDFYIGGTIVATDPATREVLPMLIRPF